MLFNIQKPSIFVHINSGTGSMEHPNSIIVRNKIEFERVDIFTSYIGSLESIIQRLHIVDIYFLSKLSYTFSWIQTKSPRQSVQALKSVKSKVTIREKCSRSVLRSI